ncbi:putative ribonuclease H-like domain-containing protein [Tanacetum coccineum]|uniref:Ribonuclease H-like domain-containing protein n=1 Tax=Tanacetum coccineum TaxID=301880 RepID=A0ABQ5CAC8_9ASTR
MISVQDYDNAEHDDVELDNTDMPMDQGEDMGNTYEQPNDEVIYKNDWTSLQFAERNVQSYWSSRYTMEEGYRALSEQINWNNPEGHRCPYDLTKPLPMQMSSQGRQIVPADFFFNNDLEYLRGGSNDKKYTASTTKSKAARYELKGIEDMVPNLWIPRDEITHRHHLNTRTTTTTPPVFKPSNFLFLRRRYDIMAMKWKLFRSTDFILSGSYSKRKWSLFQSLLSQLEIHGAGISTEDANQKFLRSLPSAWSQVSLIMRTKPGVDSLNFDDLCNNLRVFESDVKGSTASSSSMQNVAFVSENTSSTNDLDEFDLKEMDLKWQVAMISMRMKKFYKKTGRKLQFDAKEPVGFDKTKVECYSCHKTWHFARECRSKGNQDSRRRDAWNTRNNDKDNRRRSVSAVKGKRETAIKSSAGCNWRPKRHYWNQVSKYNSGSRLSIKSLQRTMELLIMMFRHSTDTKALPCRISSFNGGPAYFWRKMCDKKNKVLFTDSECLVLFLEFKLPDEHQVLLRIPRQNNMYSFNLENIVPSGGTEDNIDAAIKSSKVNNAGEEPTKPLDFKQVDKEDQEFAQETEDLLLQAGAAKASSTNIVNTASTPVSTATPYGGLSFTDLTNTNQDDSEIPALEEIYDNPTNGIFTNSSYDDEGVVADFTNLEPVVNVSPIPTSRINSIHPLTLDLRDPQSAVQTRSKVTKSFRAHAFVSYIQKQRRNNHKDFQHCLFACFLSQNEPKKISEVLEDENLPYGKKEIGTKWVYRNKKDKRGVVVRNKARLVAQGHRQEEGIDYDEVFAPVAKIEAIRIFLAFASYMGFIVYQMDVKSAFLYGKIDKEVYVSQPPGFIDPKYSKKVYKVVKALYGLHQAPRAWYATLSTFLLKNGYRRGTIDKTLFIKKDKHDIILVQVYVDDIIFGSTKNLGVMNLRSMIGSLMYLTASRPDIMFAVCACSRFQVTPKTSHLSAVKRIFRYLKGKPKLGLWYPRVSSFDLEAYSDSDYAGANLDRKSTTGGCQFLGRRLISWQCKKQTIVATSTTEAEYVAAANCCGQVLWIQNQMLDYGFNFMNTKIYIDNESTICIVKNPVYHSKTKHIAIRHHFIRDAYEKKLIQVLKIHTNDNVADLLTKAFDVSRFQFLVVSIGMINP